MNKSDKFSIPSPGMSLHDPDAYIIKIIYKYTIFLNIIAQFLCKR